MTSLQFQISDDLCLTEFRPSDVEQAVLLLNDPQIFATTLRIPFPYTTADFIRFLDTVSSQNPDSSRSRHWAIRNGQGKLIGGVSIEAGSDLAPQRGEMGYWLGRPYWGRGIMTKVVSAVSRIALTELQFAKVAAHVFSSNTASARVLQKCGFREEGYLRHHYLKSGELLDSRVFGLVPDEMRLPIVSPAESTVATTAERRIKQVIVMRHDLGMRRGKQIAQGAHASMAFLTNRLRNQGSLLLSAFDLDQQRWLTGAFAKICCRVNSEAELLEIEEKARAAGLEVHLITDSGRTEFHGQPTRTCLAIGPADAVLIDQITGHLELL